MAGHEQLMDLDSKIDDIQRQLEMQKQIKARFKQGRTTAEALDQARAYQSYLKKNKALIEERLRQDRVRRIREQQKEDLKIALLYAAILGAVAAVVIDLEKELAKEMGKAVKKAATKAVTKAVAQAVVR